MPSRATELLVLAIDIGSSSLRTALFDERSQRIGGSAAMREYQIIYTADGGAELDPAMLLRAAKSCLSKTVRAAGKTRVAAVGGSAFWHSLLGLDAKLRPITPIWTWADARAMPDAARLRTLLDERKIHPRTGCMLRASFWPAKLSWARRTDPRRYRRVRRWVSPASWIFGELFGVDECSHSMASATGLYNLRERMWDAELCNFCGVKVEQLGTISDEVEPAGAKFRNAQVFTAIGDGATSNLGSGADRPGLVAVNIGTSAALRVIEENDESRLPFGLFRHVVDESRTVLGGAVSNAGNLHRWCLRELRLGDDQPLPRRRAAEDALAVLPFWVSERAPNWPEDLRGTIVGLTQSTTAGEILRATTCSVFYRLAEILELIESATAGADEIIVSGGIRHSADALRILADAMGRDLRLSSEPEASLCGAAIHVLAGLGVEIRPLRAPKVIRYDQRLAEKHRLRRERQIALEQMLTPLPSPQ